MITDTDHHVSAPPEWLTRLSVALLALYSALSPVMFSLRSRRVQREVRLAIMTS